jgi:hypothetical protein
MDDLCPAVAATTRAIMNLFDRHIEYGSFMLGVAPFSIQ